MTRLSEGQITALFREPRTMRKFTDRPVIDDQLREIQELTYLGPRPSIVSLCASLGSRAPRPVSAWSST